MVKASFSHVRAWVFDLDNTLYPPSVNLFGQIEELMADYVSKALNVSTDKANALRKHYWATYGTTLAGLMAEHDIEPDPFLSAVHDIDFSVLPKDPDLARAINALPGRKIVYTNGTEPYARDVLKGRGLDGLFDAVYGVEHASYRPKPEQAAFEAVFALDNLPPDQGAMFEDDVRNLAAPHAMGMRTVHVAPLADHHDHIHHHTNDLTGFLSQLV
ncbi:pyrimidine 5'-nucleotidase [Octadecabacter sp. 1_MG-2023]|uniref:pyrimidine 5'-nucleotidase n=1 Tax=unclassified Octadecabacter TaxID=196158 RepID=UPI001C09CE41|nr:MULTISPECIES: pyrimidine 5'-nucleotidase [unclassified Octadecabacter]MBU2993883.1 pyrimidine 5'-nucleotidase [Octadecabacter sp. B2R22]MDO6735271.1 pyrimidine 5'-nucleotidase [Octadecabacter sp. 1_MG-2023]